VDFNVQSINYVSIFSLSLSPLAKFTGINVGWQSIKNPMYKRKAAAIHSRKRISRYQQKRFIYFTLRA
jgi:hypothetical protein